MSEESTFRDLVRRVRSGDQQAAAEVVRCYEPHILRVARLRLLRTPHLRAVLDSTDICQSVLGSFFLGVTRGQYELERPAHLLQLLSVMARHKVIDQARKKRLPRALANEPGHEPVAPGEGPGQEMSLCELGQKLRDGLTEGERHLADLRVAGRKWAEIAAEMGVSPEGLRKKLARAGERLARSLGLAWGSDRCGGANYRLLDEAGEKG